MSVHEMATSLYFWNQEHNVMQFTDVLYVIIKWIIFLRGIWFGLKHPKLEWDNMNKDVR